MNVTPTAPAPRLSPTIAIASPKGSTLTVVHGKKTTCLAFAVTRGTRFKTLLGYDLSDMGRDQLLTALLDWRFVEDELPDDACRVMLACEGTAEPIFGYIEASKWYGDDGYLFAPLVPFAWAHVPAMPAKKGGAL